MNASAPSASLSAASPSATDAHLRAARMVEGLFRVTPAACWDLLLDLRQALLEGWDAARMAPIFQDCRRELEKDHYLTFYRLRRLLEPSLVAPLPVAKAEDAQTADFAAENLGVWLECR